MKKKHFAKVRYMGEISSVETSPDMTLLQSFIKAKIPIGRSCNGEGICTTCRVLILDGEVSEPEELELIRIKERGFEENERLSCQCYPASKKLLIEVP